MSDPQSSPGPQKVPGAAATTPTGPNDAGGAPASRGRPADKIPRNFARYRILDTLGRGGMGAVFKAHDPQLDRTVALKVPFLGDDDADTRQRFFREARAAATLQHAYICPVFDVGEFQGFPYLTMAFVEGRSLSQALEAGLSYTPVQIALLMRKVALAMHEAHSKGVIHRDLKPSNILLRPNGEPMIMDFGLARRGDDKKSEGLTRKGDIIGTLEYMSPEQVEGDPTAVGHSTDIYALGVVLYEMLTGRRPFTGSTTNKITAIVLKPPTPPHELRPDVSPQLEEICLKAMAKKPADRYGSMLQLAVTLAEFLRANQQASGTTVTRPIVPPPVASPSAPTQPIRDVDTDREPGRPTSSGRRAAPSSSRRPRSSARRRRKKKSYLPLVIGAVGLTVVCVALIVCLIVISSRHGKSDTQTAAASSEHHAAPGGHHAAPGGNAQSPPPQQYRPPQPRPANRRQQQPPADPSRPLLALHTQPEVVNLTVGEPTQVTIKVDRHGTQGPIHLRWSGPKEVRVTPAGPMTLQPNDPDPVLTLRVLAEPAAEDLGLEVTASPQGPRPETVTSRLAVRVHPGPCVRVIEIADANSPIGALAFAPDASLVLIANGGGSARPSGQRGGPGGYRGPGGNGGNAPDQNAIHVWSLARGTALAPLTGLTSRATALTVAGDGRRALSVNADETVALWDLTQGRRLVQSPKQRLRVVTAAMSPDAKRGLVVYPGVIVKVSLNTFQELGRPIRTAQLMGGSREDAVHAVAVSAERKGLVGGVDGKLFVIDLTGKTKPKALVGHHEAVQCAAFAPSGNLAATGGGGVLQLGTIQPGSENIVCLWDVGGLTMKWKGEGHARPVVCVAFAPDGRLLASGSADGEIRVWDVGSGNSVATFKGHSGRVLGLAFTSDGKALWSGSADRTLRQWRLP